MSLANTDLIILAGGLGTRLSTVLDKGQPKALANIESRPFLDYLIDWLYGAGIRRITLALGYGAEHIIQHLGNLPAPEDLVINYMIEPLPLGTGGAIRYVIDQTRSDSVFVCNGDTIAELNMADMLENHLQSNAAITMALANVEDCQRFGSVEIDNDGKVTSFIEKSAANGPGLVNAGVYLIKRTTIYKLPNETTLSWEQDCLPNYCDGRLHGIANCDRFLDMGTPETLSSSFSFLNSLQDS